jgi:hypothetical protein
METSSVIVGDWNGDGNADVATGNRYDGTITIWLGRGNGLFDSRVDYSSGRLTWDLATGDWNGDGKADLAAAINDDTYISIFIGNGDGTFQSAVRPQVGGPSGSITAADFNGDGKLDLAITTSDRGTLRSAFGIMTGNGDGTFSAPALFDAGYGPSSVVAGDWNGDGRLDVAVADGLGDHLLLLLTARCP